APEAPDSISFSDVVWTTEVDPETREPQDEVSSYPNNAPAIIAAVNVEQLPGGTELVASWTIDGVEVPDARMTVATEATVVDAWVTFQFTRDGATLFPLGVLEVTITGGEGSEVTDEVEIVLPGS